MLFVIVILIIVAIVSIVSHNLHLQSLISTNRSTINTQVHEIVLKSLQVDSIIEPVDALVLVRECRASVIALSEYLGGVKAMESLCNINVDSVLQTFSNQEKAIRKHIHGGSRHPLSEYIKEKQKDKTHDQKCSRS